MKKAMIVVSALLASSTAYAADTGGFYEPAPQAPAVAAPFDWTGPYIGVFGGVTTGDFEYEAGADGIDERLNVDISGGGFVGGAQVGYDWQASNWVFGGVADIAFTNHSAEISGSIDGLGSASAESKLKYLGTLRGRVGYAFDRALIYGHGGLAFGKTEQTISIDGLGSVGESQSRTGWTIGAGAEYAVTDRVSLGTEYSYVDLGTERLLDEGGIFVDEDVAFHSVKALLNFRF